MVNQQGKGENMLLLGFLACLPIYYNWPFSRNYCFLLLLYLKLWNYRWTGVQKECTCWSGKGEWYNKLDKNCSVIIQRQSLKQMLVFRLKSLCDTYLHQHSMLSALFARCLQLFLKYRLFRCDSLQFYCIVLCQFITVLTCLSLLTVQRL